MRSFYLLALCTALAACQKTIPVKPYAQAIEGIAEQSAKSIDYFRVVDQERALQNLLSYPGEQEATKQELTLEQISAIKEKIINEKNAQFNAAATLQDYAKLLEKIDDADTKDEIKSSIDKLREEGEKAIEAINKLGIIDTKLDMDKVKNIQKFLLAIADLRLNELKNVLLTQLVTDADPAVAALVDILLDTEESAEFLLCVQARTLAHAIRDYNLNLAATPSWMKQREALQNVLALDQQVVETHAYYERNVQALTAVKQTHHDLAASLSTHKWDNAMLQRWTKQLNALGAQYQQAVLRTPDALNVAQYYEQHCRRTF
ncbi:hypothetical protein [Alcaligenes endophyticus]|uniref:Lipoprotein n=1 Tax=Alcaligenes endophyticus TaxID=1929088 RepID=A0ABT8EFZ9_9BURK|nr:hypothetical protein [Alcaligenes endophyticus]MCX5590214.1 hypothetical protein [Alcaligenes endophyticus]MDN4120122.1 hypothetical protein [Alcaligenes endophyticus]